MEKSKKNLYTFSFKLAVLIIVLVVVLSYFFLPYVPDVGEDQKYKFGLNLLSRDEKKDFDMVFLGNSYSFTAYDTSVIQNELGLNSIHINSGAQRLETSLLVADYALEVNNKIKIMVFDVSTATLLRPKKDEKEIWYYQTLALQEIPFSFHKALEVTKFFPLKEYPEYYTASLSKTMGRLFRLNDRVNYHMPKPSDFYRSPKNATLFSYNGYMAKAHYPIDKNGFAKSFKKRPLAQIKTDSIWGKDLQEKLIRFVQKAKKGNVKILLVNSLKLFDENYDQEFLNALMEEYENVSFLNLNAQRDKYYLNEKSFYNSTHLNFSGSQQVTKRMCDSLSKWYKLPKQNTKQYSFGPFRLNDVFYNLKENQDKVIKLTFDKLPFKLNDHQLVVSLFPKDTAKLSKYSKKRGFRSDNFYVKNPSTNNIDVGDSKSIIMKLDTEINDSDIEKIKVFFYKSKDTLRLPSYDIQLNN
ncbi:MAG: hypothetical protein R2819_05790 [Allomuricauda sp.]